MCSEDSIKMIIGVFSAITFLVGIGIGVKLYNVTSDSSSTLDSNNTVFNDLSDSQTEN